MLVCSSKTAPRILIFSIILGAENLSYVIIETHVRTFLPLNISAVGSVLCHGGLYRWKEKLKEILIRYSRIIITASKDRLISKI